MISGLAIPSYVADPVAEDIAALEELANLLATLPQFSIFAVIFIKNISTLLLSFVLSPIFCLVPVLALIANGWIIAFVSTEVVQQISLGFLLAGLLPHGIFELPALIMGQAAALSFGTMAILVLFKRGKVKLLLPNLRQNLRYLIIAFTLLLPAAIIETYLTPLLLK